MKTNLEKSGTLFRCQAGGMGRWLTLATCLMFLGFAPRTMAQAPTPPTVTVFTVLVAEQPSGGTTTAVSLPFIDAANIASYQLKMTTTGTGVTFTSGETGTTLSGDGDITFSLETSGNASLPVGDYPMRLYLFSEETCQDSFDFVVSVKPMPVFTPSVASRTRFKSATASGPIFLANSSCNGRSIFLRAGTSG